MRIAIVSDTHGHVEYTRRAVRLIEALEVELVLHCGDIGSVAIPPLLERWPAHYVFGNVDYNRAELTEAIEACGHTSHGAFGELELAGRRIAFLHGDDERRLEQAIRQGGYDLVCHGHTHVARREQQGRTLVLNPGALYRANPHSFALVELPQLAIESIAVERPQ